MFSLVPVAWPRYNWLLLPFSLSYPNETPSFRDLGLDKANDYFFSQPPPPTHSHTIFKRNSTSKHTYISKLNWIWIYMKDILRNYGFYPNFLALTPLKLGSKNKKDKSPITCPWRLISIPFKGNLVYLVVHNFSHNAYSILRNYLSCQIFRDYLGKLPKTFVNG